VKEVENHQSVTCICRKLCTSSIVKSCMHPFPIIASTQKLKYIHLQF